MPVVGREELIGVGAWRAWWRRTPFSEWVSGLFKDPEPVVRGAACVMSARTVPGLVDTGAGCLILQERYQEAYS